MIITQSGEPLRATEGSPILIPGEDEARRWLMPHDRGIERWEGSFKPMVQYRGGEWES